MTTRLRLPLLTFVAHLSLTALMGLAAGYFDLGRGQHGTAPVSAIEAAVKTIWFVLTVPVAQALRVLLPQWNEAILVGVVANSAFWSWALVAWRRRARLLPYN